jgi:hypothetical protein
MTMLAVSPSIHTHDSIILRSTATQKIVMLHFATVRIRKFTTFCSVYHTVLRNGVIKFQTQGPHFHLFETIQVPVVHVLYWTFYNL